MLPEKERSNPRISVNKLGEHMTAAPLRRRRIIEDQKRPKDFIVPRYTEAQEAISTYLAGGAQDDGFLLGEINRLMSAPAKTEWDEQRKLLCAEAIERFMDLTDNIELDGLTIATGQADPPQMLVAGVSISVRPEVIVTGTNRNGASIVGALKLYFSKTNPLNDDSGAYVATTVHQFADTFLHDSATADYRRCQVIDVFSGGIYVAPRSYLRRRNDIEAACEEIARGWPVL